MEVCDVCVPCLYFPPTVGTFDMAGSVAQQVVEVGVEAPGGDGELLQCRHAGAGAQGRQVERSDRSSGSIQHRPGILNWTLSLIGRLQARYSRLIG